jgi:hypothetical protein
MIPTGFAAVATSDMTLSIPAAGIPYGAPGTVSTSLKFVTLPTRTRDERSGRIPG